MASNIASISSSLGSAVSSTLGSIPAVKRSSSGHVNIAVKEAPVSQPSRRTPRLKDHGAYEEEILARTLEDAGHWATGVVAVELWSFREEDDRLFRPKGGLWADLTLHEHEDYKSCHQCQTGDPFHPLHKTPPDLAPGVAIPGVLWGELGRARKVKASRPDRRTSRLDRRTSTPQNQRPRRTSIFDNFDREEQNNGAGVDEAATKASDIQWRNVQALAADPDQPYNERLQRAAENGIGYAGGVPFNVDGFRGLVVYYARINVDLQLLQTRANITYLLKAGDYVASVWALRAPREAAVYARQSRLDATLRRVRAKLQAIVMLGITLEHVRNNQVEVDEEDTKQSSLSIHDPIEAAKMVIKGGKTVVKETVKQSKKTASFTYRKAYGVYLKFWGADVPGPPAFTWEATAWTFVGSLITMLLLVRLNIHLEDWYGPEWSLTMGPLSSFTASVFVLTAAPASQPRNNLVAQIFAMVLGLCLAYATGIDPWVRQAFGVSILVAAMCKFGFIHAPASGTAFTFASGSQHWSNVISMICANLVVITMGSIVNNLNSKRQYPTSWGLRPVILAYRENFPAKKEE